MGANDDPAGADPSAAFQDEYDDALATDGNDAFPQTDDSMPAAFAPDSDFQFVGGGWDDGGVVITGDDGSDLGSGSPSTRSRRFPTTLQADGVQTTTLLAPTLQGSSGRVHGHVGH